MPNTPDPSYKIIHNHVWPRNVVVNVSEILQLREFVEAF